MFEAKSPSTTQELKKLIADTLPSDDQLEILKKEFLKKVTIDDFISEALSELTENYQKRDAIKALLEAQPKMVVDDFVKILAQLCLTEEVNVTYKYDIISKFLLDANSYMEALEKILQQPHIDRHETITNFIKSQENDAKRLDTLIAILKNPQFSMQYNTTTILGLCVEIWGNDPSDSKIPEILTKVAQSLYGNISPMQIVFFYQAVDEGCIDKGNITKLGFDQINDNDVFDFLHCEEVVCLELGPKEILEIAQGRMNFRYNFLKTVIGNKPVSQCFKSNGVQIVKNLFGAEKLSELSLLDIFFYYEITNKIDDFFNLLTPQWQQKITSNFQPNDNILLITNQEITKLEQLTKTRNIKTKFLPTTLLCDYFKSRITITPLSENQIKNFTVNFSGCELSTDQQAQIENHFKDILPELSEEGERKEKILNFFKSILGEEDFNDISDANKKTLIGFFINSKNRITYLLQQEGGLQTFINHLAALNDGCLANIGNHISIALYQSILKNPCDSILYQFLTEQVIIPTLNNPFSDDVIGSEGNPLINDSVQKCHICAPAMLNGIAKIFYDPTLSRPIKRSPFGFIGEILGDEVMENLIINIDANEAKAAQIAAYLVIKNNQVIYNDFKKLCPDICLEIENLLVRPDLTPEAPNTSTARATAVATNHNPKCCNIL